MGWTCSPSCCRPEEFQLHSNGCIFAALRPLRPRLISTRSSINRPSDATNGEGAGRSRAPLQVRSLARREPGERRNPASPAPRPRRRAWRASSAPESDGAGGSGSVSSRAIALAGRSRPSSRRKGARASRTGGEGDSFFRQNLRGTVPDGAPIISQLLEMVRSRKLHPR